MEEKMTFEELEKAIIQWADEREIFSKGDTIIQACKTIEEVTEIISALQRNVKEEIIDGIGDALVTLIIQAKMNNVSVIDCLQAAYMEIKDRKGKMVAGTFVKVRNAGYED